MRFRKVAFSPVHTKISENLKVRLARFKTLIQLSGPVAQWITRLTTDQKIPGSNPGRFVTFQVTQERPIPQKKFNVTGNLALTVNMGRI